ncbi:MULTISPECIES: zonular occludens toxin domain-containing protein [unclassified Streptomyces]|uniref:zonular occludens toxin domain-containing protein n=1 Tax=unclassified Streptomyces TaxID=2593676 RepID=UPI001AFA61B2|nr:MULTISPECIES: zonular occludens toxin domain-containing protein [unclassified Streptomyces]CAD5959348.1 Cell division protein FtsK [Streptomyces sp. KY75]CAD5980771.1 Cell division protein FtsK [Streptomyces sp. KY70]
MTEPAVQVPGMGTVHHLDDHRPTPPAEPVADLTKPDTDPTTPAVPQGSRIVRTGRAVRRAALHDRTRSTARFTVRHGMYVVGGGRIVARRAWEGRTASRYLRMLRAAEAAGNTELAEQWEERLHRFRAERHKRRMDLLTAPQQAVKAAGFGAAGGLGLLLAVGIALAIATKDPADVITPLMALVELIRLLVVIVTVVWGPLLAVGPWLALAAVWAVGRNQQAAPAWAMPATTEGESRDVVPDEGAILDALRHLGIPKLNQAFKAGWQPRWVAPTTRLGNGWHSRLQLPMGVTVEMVNDKKAILAHNLMRKPVEVWPTEPEASVLDLWVADQGSLSGKVPDWPLLTGGEADYFKGVPIGVSQRGDLITAKLMATNWIVGGIMGSGKSSLVIALLLGAMLDPLVDIEAYVMAYNVDYDPMRERLRALVKGDEDEQIEAAVKALRGLRQEVTDRGKLLEQLGGDEVRLTRALAQRDPRMRPKVVVFDECHELFMHKKYGEEAAELAVKVMKKARKVGITLIFVTVSPTADSIPKDVTRNTSHRAAFAVGDHVANDGLLGTGKHKAGITATNLNPAENVGTALTVGFTKNPFELIRSYYVRKDSSTDQITPVVKRALALREGMAPTPDVPTGEPADHPANVLTVLGDRETMRSTEVLAALMATWPNEYSEWTFADLKAALAAIGAEPRKLGGIMTVRRSRVLEGIEDRDDNTHESDAS